MIPPDRLLQIGSFARLAGVTPSMLRFYADCGLVPPRRTDPVTGYRFYSPEQVDDVHLVRRLRDLGLPLAVVGELLTAAGAEAEQAIERRLVALKQEWLRAQDSARAARALLRRRHGRGAQVSGSALVAAIRRVGRAAARDEDFPVLGGVLVEITGEELRIVATDRYRLALQSLAITERLAPAACVLPADDLPAVLGWAERAGKLTMQTADGRLSLTGEDGETRNVQGLAEPFPDYGAVLASLPAATTSVGVARGRLVELLEQAPVTRLLVDPAGAVGVQPEGSGAVRLPAVVRGRRLDISFRRETLHPAVGDSIGPDVLLEMTRPDAPAVVRSADDGTFTTLAMPTPPHTPTEVRR
jgi:DNA polymerase III subunit beta